MRNAVNAGLVNITIADDFTAEFWAKIFPKLTLNKIATVRTGGDIAWMIRKDSPQLKAELNDFLARYPVGSMVRTTMLHKYLQNAKFAKDVASKEELVKFEHTVDFFRKYGDKYELEYLSKSSPPKSSAVRPCSMSAISTSTTWLARWSKNSGRSTRRPKRRGRRNRRRRNMSHSPKYPMIYEINTWVWLGSAKKPNVP
jgi:hypothetical protein